MMKSAICIAAYQEFIFTSAVLFHAKERAKMAHPSEMEQMKDFKMKQHG